MAKVDLFNAHTLALLGFRGVRVNVGDAPPKYLKYPLLAFDNTGIYLQAEGSELFKTIKLNFNKLLYFSGKSEEIEGMALVKQIRVEIFKQYAKEQDGLTEHSSIYTLNSIPGVPYSKDDLVERGKILAEDVESISGITSLKKVGIEALVIAHELYDLSSKEHLLQVKCGVEQLVDQGKYEYLSPSLLQCYKEANANLKLGLVQK